MNIVLKKDYSISKKGDLICDLGYYEGMSLIGKGIAREASLDDLALGKDASPTVKKVTKSTKPKTK